MNISSQHIYSQHIYSRHFLFILQKKNLRTNFSSKQKKKKLNIFDLGLKGKPKSYKNIYINIPNERINFLTSILWFQNIRIMNRAIIWYNINSNFIIYSTNSLVKQKLIIEAILINIQVSKVKVVQVMMIVLMWGVVRVSSGVHVSLHHLTQLLTRKNLFMYH